MKRQEKDLHSILSALRGWSRWGRWPAIKFGYGYLAIAICNIALHVRHVEVEAAVVGGGGSADLTVVWVNSLQGTSGLSKLQAGAPRARTRLRAAEATHSRSNTVRAHLIAQT